MTRPKESRPLNQGLLQRQFDLIVDAALANERCPVIEPYGPLIQSAMKRMRALGWIDWEIVHGGWRVVTILTGPHVNKTTAAYPSVTTVKSHAPSAPRPLTHEELER